jgi:hypothetical protein
VRSAGQMLEMAERRARGIVLGGLLAIALAGCTGDPEVAQPTVGRRADDRVPPAERVVPGVAEPVELGDFVARPCGLVPANPHAEPPLHQAGRADGQRCQWFAGGPAPVLELVLFSDKEILREVYASTPADELYFAPFESRGLPAVMVVESRDSGVCTLTVGLSDRQGIQFRDFGNRVAANCEVALKALEVASGLLRSRG